MTAWCYQLDGVMIDTGIRHLRAAILESVRDAKPEFILITHYHEDHSANTGAIHTTLGIPVYGNPLTAKKLSAPFKLRPYQYLMWGRSDPVDIDIHAPIHDTGRCRFRPIHTPGHSKDHTVYLEEKQGYLFSGDLFLGERIKYFRADECLADQLISLKKVLALDFDALFCAHRPLMEKGKEAIQRKLDFLENFKGSVSDLKNKGLSLKAVIKQLDTGEDRPVKWLTLNNVSFANMVKSAYSDGV
ncbi:MAG: MBL fold metallo-hydrolase [Desulfobacteraceae bacterium]|nr:MBL fold metallo-hydrolase [Desulfobacteraceae bacterium]